MRFTKPAWVKHTDSGAGHADSSKRLAIFSVHVHPDGSRIATGGIDTKVRIWSTKPILNAASEAANRPPKSLSTLMMHTGPVLTVRWAHSGKWLASGSDDKTIMIWDFDPSAKGKLWGSDEVNVEGWRALKSLTGHGSDVTDVAWSPGDRYLASAGLDSKVIIWCGYTHEQLRKLDQHQGFVKGVCWDPVGEFLATQSDDRSVKIWNTTDWSLEATVTKPFEDSPGSTFFRRLSWSPDGAHITASNATNNKGFVFIAAVITRNSWTSEISLVGHENTVEVAAYNPHIFLRNPQGQVQTSNICSVVALGADDHSVSIWQTKSARPLIVAKDVFDRHIMDLNWSWDGLNLYAVSSDGTLAAFSFDEEELEGLCPNHVQSTYLKKFPFTPPMLPAGFSHESLRLTPPPSPKAHDTGFGAANSNMNGERVNVLVAKRGGKKRAGFLTVPPGHPPAPAPAAAAAAASSISAPPFATPSLTGVSISKHSQSHHQRAPSPFDMDEDNWGSASVRIDAVEETGSRKRRASTAAMNVDGEEPKRARTLGAERKRVNVPVKELAPQASHGASSISNLNLLVPSLMSFLSATVEGSDDVVEVVNPESEDGCPEVVMMSGRHPQWLDYLPSPALAVSASSRFCAVALRDGSVIVYSHAGRRLMPTLALGSPCSFLDGRGNILMAISSSGMLHSWDIRKQSALFPAVSLSTILTTPNIILAAARVQPTGASILTCSNGIVYSYDPSLMAFTKLTERWWSEGSDVWQARQRSATNPTANRGIVSVTEGSIAGETTGADKKRPKFWSEAMTLAHLETRMHSARALDSPAEFKQALSQYTKKLAEEGYKNKAEELIRDLIGPMYAGGDPTWAPSVAGLSKRDLLKDVLSAFSRSKNLGRLAVEWQDAVRRAD
ncbi:unnamed protein product [Mycena citricolor]|uniref:Protein HIR n=1 Tax=Mycena citricolor TaxID=2018698 RepID=A0AAD2HZ74_9AGAR|nr:unnamed protein product [Mycena citricolor]